MIGAGALLGSGVLVALPTPSGAANDAGQNIPVIFTVTPSIGAPGGGNQVMITGRHFRPGGGPPAVWFGAKRATVVSYAHHVIVVVVPAGVVGTVDITVRTINGYSLTTYKDRYVYGLVPTVSGVSPGTGPAPGGNSVTITGSNLSNVFAVNFGGTPASQVVTNGGGTSLTATAPAGTAGTMVNVTVSTVVGTSQITPADQYIYAGRPVVTAVSPLAGVPGGGTPVSITGSGFTGATSVTFNGVAATGVVVNSDTSISATAPAGSGTVDVIVSGPNGTSSVTAADHYVYEGVPIVQSVQPAFGPATGGAQVTVTGGNFLAASAVDFNGTPSTSFTVTSSTTLTAVAPPGTGTVDVTVVTPVGTSATSSADQFTYVSGTARAWGDNSYSQLGYSTSPNVNSPSPIAVPGLGTVAQLAGGGASTLALSTTGNVWAWGDDGSGELGDGQPATMQASPVEVLGPAGNGFLSGVVAVASGAAAGYALTASGNVYAWGDNTSGELGINSTQDSSTPVPVLGPGGSGLLSGVVAIATHGDSAYALTASGNVYAWGDDGQGQLGNNALVNSPVPVAVQAVGGGGTLSGIVSISAGDSTAYGVTSSGQVVAWGGNGMGQLGNGSTAAYSAVPVTVSGLSNVIEVAGGLFHALALTSAGTVFAWGDNSAGELALTASSTPRRTPVLVAGLGAASQIAAGYDYSMAIAAGGSLFTWGYDLDGELGNGVTPYANSSTPTQVGGITAVGIYGGWTQSLEIG
ncbi:MAG TPA: IPT/TIG domain-containing protein [Acidimicrobiales bacterium]|nr:IPT/TIG domain-containing protein [Acidimicrobiales bacterium]